MMSQASVQDWSQSADIETGEQKYRDFATLMEVTPRSETIAISCVDYREKGREGYLLTSAGAVPHDHLMDDLHLILPGKRLLLLRGHTDCAKSKAQVARIEDEPEADYSTRVEAQTMKRLWAAAETLLGDDAVKNAMNDGLKFCVALYDVLRSETIYFERESAELAQRMMLDEDLNCGLLERLVG